MGVASLASSDDVEDEVAAFTCIRELGRRAASLASSRWVVVAAKEAEFGTSPSPSPPPCCAETASAEAAVPILRAVCFSAALRLAQPSVCPVDLHPATHAIGKIAKMVA